MSLLSLASQSKSRRGGTYDNNFANNGEVEADPGCHSQPNCLKDYFDQCLKSMQFLSIAVANISKVLAFTTEECGKY